MYGVSIITSKNYFSISKGPQGVYSNMTLEKFLIVPAKNLTSTNPNCKLIHLTLVNASIKARKVKYSPHNPQSVRIFCPRRILNSCVIRETMDIFKRNSVVFCFLTSPPTGDLIMYRVRCGFCEETYLTKGRECDGITCRFGEGYHRHLICPTCGSAKTNAGVDLYDPSADRTIGDTVTERQAIAALCRASASVNSYH